jgi:hypothetical protein
MPREPDVRFIVPDNLTDEDIAVAWRALQDLARILGRASAAACHRLGISFDMDDPQVARDKMLATFEALVFSEPSKGGELRKQKRG